MIQGVVRGIAYRPDHLKPMVEVTAQHASSGRGIEGDRRAKGKRGITLLSAERWADVVREIGQPLPWHTRRANVLVEGVDLLPLIGYHLRIGDLIVKVWDETRPCDEMEEFCVGLKEALKPNGRGGVHGEILRGGMIRIGDGVQLIDGVDRRRTSAQPPSGRDDQP